MGKVRLTAAERSEQLVAAAISAFSTAGYAATTTDDVARLANVSQPYVIRLFGSKRKLFIAGIERAASRVEQAFRDAGTDLDDLATAYDRLLAERELLAMLLQGYAASADPEIGAVVRDRFGRIYLLIKELTGADAGAAKEFLATGMLLTVLGALQVIGPGAVPAEPWVLDLLGAIPKFTGDLPKR